MARRKVLVLPAWYPSERDPVWGTFVREQARAVSALADVAVLHVEHAWPRPGRLLEVRDGRENGLRTVRLRVLRAPAPAVLANELAALAAGLRRLMRSGFVPDVIHAHVFKAGFYATQLGRALGIPVVISEHYSAFPRRLLRWWERPVARRAFAAAEIVAPVTDDLRSHIEAYGMSARFEVVPNVVDDALFRPPDREGRSESPSLLVVASLIPLKGVDRVVRAVARLSSPLPVRLDVVGEGAERPELERLARELGIEERVAFHGYLAPADVAAAMRRADALVVASDWENLPVALLEAQASGLPVVATAVGGIPEIVGPSQGLLVPARDTSALADALDRLLSTLGRYDREAIADAARRRFGARAVAERWDGVYAEAESLARRRGRRPRTRAASTR